MLILTKLKAQAVGRRLFKGWQLLAARLSPAVPSTSVTRWSEGRMPRPLADMNLDVSITGKRRIGVVPNGEAHPTADVRAGCAVENAQMPTPPLLAPCSCRGQLDPLLVPPRESCLPVPYMNVDVPVADARRIEVVANGLLLWHGPQLALDATIVSPLTRLGEAHPRADVQPGCAVIAAGAGSDIKPSLNSSSPGDAALLFSASRQAAGLELSPLLAVAAERTFAASFLDLPPAAELGECPEPQLHELFAEARWDHVFQAVSSTSCACTTV
ncbi:hypothetical protein AK812_SmicGene40774 [Symbiodinium microadriaticum]|uniref:Uncharacterized protein n=1 Tax=Symbiodinium microadriaticum TaxID=2951 RepID=A0A1Q9C7V1_SYMMI|nr:hypothetical protein AK812_SmicGene40774 [Symbiodinium microadriaticum]